MSWILKDRPKTLKVSKALAKEFAEMDPAPHDRPLSERRLTVYERLLKEGSFRPVTWARAYCTETGASYRVNGKHTSTLLSGLKEMPEFFVTIEDYICETLEDVARLYATFDSSVQSRTANDIYLSFAGTIPQLRSVSRRVITLAATGMAYHNDPTSSQRSQPTERAETLLEHPEFVLWLSELISSDSHENTRQHSRHLMRQGVGASMFGCWQKAKAPATDFWVAVRDETGNAPNLPDRKLARYLREVGVKVGIGATRTRTADTREVYVKCLHAWNAWRRNETTNLNYYPDKDVPAIR